MSKEKLIKQAECLKYAILQFPETNFSESENKVFQQATEFGFDFEDEPHHSYLLGATELEQLNYLIEYLQNYKP